ncbi:glycosyltransferase family 39 protein [Conexibacter woesei]|uniref:glycosyltransferase family 39 protein n=1 Tax=Conexibacter woesei TaxID=191495 RepID=UPI00041208A7|nr:glycosyltransferase family 39 protein [Conexibacter woesei]
MASTTTPLPPPAQLTSPLSRRATHARRRPAVLDRFGRVQAGLLAVLVLAALLCCWDLTRDGMSNTYYAAAVKSASESWKALFFGSLDPGSFITVDKPPLAIWMMGLSARVFGFSSFSMLLPDALCTIGAVALLHATVRRVTGSTPAALAAAALLAITPVTVAIARVNNPDALLILLLVASAYMVVRALESGRTKHLVWAGVFVGLAFMTKMLQGWMVVPALGATYLLAGLPALWTRVRQLAVAGVAMVVVSAAWPVAVTLWPGSRPYIGGSTDGSIWDLILGYNGFGRLFGENGGGGGASFGGEPGLLRLFNTEVGGQIAWLLPLAAVGLVAALVLTRRAPRTDRLRAGAVLFGVWALVHVAIFSTAKGTFHPYYTSALAPAVAALGGIGLVLLGTRVARSWVALGGAAVGVGATAALSVSLLDRTPDFHPWLRVAIPVAAVVAVLAAVALRLGAPRRVLAVAAVAAVVAVGAGPLSYSLASVGRSLNGNNVLAGPSEASAGGFGGMGGGAMRGGNGGPPSGGGTTGTRPSFSGGTPPSGAQQGAGGGGGMGGGGTLSTSVIKYLEAHQGSAKYLLAATGSQTTANIIISTGKAVVTIGGFSGSDPAPKVSQFVAMVRSGQVKYVLVGSGGGGGMGGSSSSDLTTWIKAHARQVSGVTVASGTLYAVSA